MRQEKGKPIEAKTLNRLPSGVEALAARVAGPGLRGGDSAGVPLRSLTGPTRALVRLTGTGPYGAVEVVPVAGGGWADLVNGRTLAAGTVREDNGVAGLTGKKVEVELTGEGDWRFAYPRESCGDCTCCSAPVFTAMECGSIITDTPTPSVGPFGPQPGRGMSGVTCALWDVSVTPAVQKTSCTTDSTGSCTGSEVCLPRGTAIEWRFTTAEWGVCVIPGRWGCPAAMTWSPPVVDFYLTDGGGLDGPSGNPFGGDTQLGAKCLFDWGLTCELGTPWGDVTLTRAKLNDPFRGSIGVIRSGKTLCSVYVSGDVNNPASYKLICVDSTGPAYISFSFGGNDGYFRGAVQPCRLYFTACWSTAHCDIPVEDVAGRDCREGTYVVQPASSPCGGNFPGDPGGFDTVSYTMLCCETDDMYATCEACFDREVILYFTLADMRPWGTNQTFTIARTPTP